MLETNTLMAKTKGHVSTRISSLQKLVLSFNCKLQLICIKPKWLGISHGEFILIPCTHSSSHYKS